ncbi:MAG: DUF3883 domain-containing protein [Halieaceae bacterium]|uniref:DUF3883 domain-containing protein n=1 Tax=Haliea alexandrii TaxID=2448162 RepID=UPI000F0BD6D1|nr:DUF3883 domain-containing protein [Haliea alexandrii]MCR9184233.1 DUF3883 domain-containing protein [Halieaceae bacterium]
MAWSRRECKAIVADYFSMLHKDVLGEKYSKSEHRRMLISQLQGRNHGAIEFKHQNISAVLSQLGRLTIKGYRPAWNYQKLLFDVVEEYVNANESLVQSTEDFLISRLPVSPITPTANVWDDAPERDLLKFQRQAENAPSFTAHKLDFSQLERRNRRLGELGEAFVLELERQRFLNIGKQDLAAEVQWSSKDVGDGLGYDIRSFDDSGDQEKFIEVKTTNAGKYQPFMISKNEVSFSKISSSQYSLYRVFQFSDTPRIYRLDGDVSSLVNLTPTNFRASF